MSATILVRLGEAEQAEPILAGLGEREHGEMRIAAAVLRLAQDDLQAATAALAPVLAASARVGSRLGVVNLGAAGWLLSLGRGGPGRRGCRGGRA
jgi:hypothetical protein